MIALVTGPPGAGKTLYAMRKFTEAMLAGKCVAGNVELSPDWADQIARRVPGMRFRRQARAAKAATLASRHYYSEDLGELFRLRLDGRGEGRGVMILDEAHNWMNARRWGDDGRDRIVKFFTQHRKLGWDVYLITQDETMLDKQVRDLYEYHVHLKNLKRFRVLGIPLSPVKLFVAVWAWHGIRIADKAIVKREFYKVGWQARLYDTFGLHHGLTGDDPDAIWLPRREDVRGPVKTEGPVTPITEPSNVTPLYPESAADPPS